MISRVCHEEEADTGQGTQSVEVCSPFKIPPQQAPRPVLLKAEDTILRPPGRDPRQQVPLKLATKCSSSTCCLGAICRSCQQGVRFLSLELELGAEHRRLGAHIT